MKSFSAREIPDPSMRSSRRRTTPGARAAVRALLAACCAALCAGSACTEVRPIAVEFAPLDVPTFPRIAAPGHKRLRVAVETFATSWGADELLQGRGTTLAALAADAAAEELATDCEVVLDRSSRDGAASIELRGRLVGDTRGAQRIELTLATPDDQILASSTQACSVVRAHELDLEALRVAVRALVPSIEALAWSSAVLDTSQRFLVIAAGEDCGLVIGERLIVRRRDATGSTSVFAGQQVARVIVDTFVDRDGEPAGAYCRLAGGSIGGFEPRELVVVEH